MSIFRRMVKSQCSPFSTERQERLDRLVKALSNVMP